jgi:hypothetical protein
MTVLTTHVCVAAICAHNGTHRREMHDSKELHGGKRHKKRLGICLQIGVAGYQSFCLDLGRIFTECSEELTVGGKFKSLEDFRILFGEGLSLLRAKYIGEPMFRDGKGPKSLH